MKRIILTLALSLVSFQSQAQITLSNSNNPVSGDVDHYRMCDTTNITPGNSGVNQSWNYTALTFEDSTTVSFVNANSTPFAAQFPTSNMASTNDNSAYSYLTTSSSNILINGTAATDLIVNYSDPQLFMQYPFNYSNSFTDNFAAHFTSGTFETFRTGTTTISSDAWGTITVPSGTFPNSLRIKYVTVTKDSSNIGTVLTSTLTSYNWFVTGRKFPIFEIIYISYSVNGFPLGNEKVVNYSTGSPIGITNISSETPLNYTLSQNYPNPFNPATNLEFGISKLGFVSLKIYDLVGKEVITLVNSNLNPGRYKYDFDASGLSSGIYFYTLRVNDFVETKRMNLAK